MIVSNCPRCHEAFRIPSGELPEGAYAKCPWCRETFSLTDVLANLPPILEVLSADGQSIVSSRPVAAVGSGGGMYRDDAGFEGIALDSQSTAETLAEGGALESFEDVDGTLIDETIVDESWGPNQSSAAAAKVDHVHFEMEDPNDSWKGEQRSSSIAPMKVPPKRKKSKYAGLKTAVGVILGGALAFPIADGLLVLAGKPGIGFWSSILGTESESSGRNTVAAAVPFDLSAGHSTPLTKPSGRLLLPDAINQELSAADDAADSAREQIMRQPNVEEPFAVTESDLAQRDLPQVQPAETPQLDTAGSQAKTDVIPPESAKMIELAGRAGKMVDAVSAFDGDEQERTRRLEMTYENIAMACALASGESDAIRALATKIKESPISKEIEQSASKWLVDSSRTSDGIALIGRPGADDKGPIITLESGKIVSVLGDVLLPSAERILAMGTIVTEGSSVEVVLAEALP